MWAGKFARTEGEGKERAVSTLAGNLIVLIRELFGIPVVGNSVNGT
jgi:hypothetical protein